MGHRRGAGLPLSEWLFRLSHLRPLEAPYLRCELLQRRRYQGQSGHELRVAVPLDYLVGYGLDAEAKPGAYTLLYLGGTVA